MPKSLREPPPSSSVARLLDVEAASRALAPPQPATLESARERAASAESAAAQGARSIDLAVPLPLTARSGEPAHIKREFVLSSSTDEAFTRLVELYRRSTGTRLSSSHVARALLKGIAHCMDSLEREARRIGPMRLPSNARGREGQRESFERRIAEAFVAGIRAAAAMD